MNQIVAKQLTKRVRQLDDTQAEKVLTFVEFLLTHARQQDERHKWQATPATLKILNKVYGNARNASENATYRLALQAMLQKGLPKW